MELIYDYDYIIEYYLGKANVVADALSRKSGARINHIRIVYLPILLSLHSTRTLFTLGSEGSSLVFMWAQSLILDEIIED